MNLSELPISVLNISEDQQVELGKLGIQTVEDLLTYFPFRYDDFRLTELSSAAPEDRVTIQGKVISEPSLRWYGKKRSRLAVKVDVDGLPVRLFWFNQFYLKKKIQPGQVLAVSGRWNAKRREVVVDRTFLSEKEQQKQLGRFESIYSITGEIKMHWLRQLIYQAFVQYGAEIKEALPQVYLERYRLLPRAKAMYYLHFPKRKDWYHHARRRMVYEELFLYEASLMWLKKKRQQANQGISHNFSIEQVQQLITQLPFSLTSAQQQVVTEILEELQAPIQMNRLLQGDVGSGKTIVAAVALYANYLSGYQGALMVPTEILADQHLQSLKDLFSNYEIRISALTGSMTTKQRKNTLEQIQSGEIDIIVGTHALIQEPVDFRQLGLIIMDEQHRFGVKQRAALREKGITPDVLCMTATPIPRTLAITFFGEMDVSTIHELPKGRQPIHTYWVKKDLWSRVVGFLQKECKQGFQAYVICPLIEESEKMDLQNAEEVYAELTKSLAPLRVGLLHGRMNPTEKDEVMKAFTQNTIQVLVSTTVVEVGVNIPNATLMIIYDADRFGLAQLHQLRGRVGRGNQASTCILIADPKSEIGVQRMKIMTETTDGFEIAKRDLELRGPGDFLGIKQSGLPEFRVADLMTDTKVLEIARKDASEWVASLDEKMDSEEKWIIEKLENMTTQQNLD